MTEQKPALSRLWFAASVVLLIFFSFSRLSDLSSRPLHHDEGVNGVFMKNLVVNNDFKYDPENYHGPSLFYFQLIPTWINTWLKDGKNFNHKSVDGLTPAGVRTTVGIAGMFLLLMILMSSNMIGRFGAFVAFLLAGFSCDLLFFSRYFIHEIFVVIFTYGVVLALYRYYQTRRVRYAYFGVLSAVLLFCTKETSIPHLIILGLAWILAETTKWLVDGRTAPMPFERMALEPSRVYGELGFHGPTMLVMATIVWFLLFSSFMTNPKGAIDSLRAYFFWGGEGFHSGHEKAFFYYAGDILLRYETPLVVTTVIGLLIAFARNEMVGLFLAYWTMGIIAFYSIVPYKTPWLIVNFVVPMALLSGYGIQAVTSLAIERLDALRAAVTLIFFYGTLIFISAAQIPQTFRVAYREYDNDRHPQIYAHTVRDVFDMLARIDAAAVRTGLGRKMVINIFSDQYWPLPFYLVKYDSPLFWGKVEGVENADAPVIIALPQQREKLDAILRDSYAVTTHNLRPGVPLLLYVNNRVNQGGEQQVLAPIDLQKSAPAPKALKGGLKLDVFKGTKFEGAPFRTVDGDAGWDFNYDFDGKKPYQSPFGLRWTGYIKAAKAGKYRFSLDSDDGSWLDLDGQNIIDNGGDHPPLRLSREVNLSEGFHKIEVRYYDSLGGALLRFTWIQPDAKEETVPFAAVYQP